MALRTDPAELATKVATAREQWPRYSSEVVVGVGEIGLGDVVEENHVTSA